MSNSYSTGLALGAAYYGGFAGSVSDATVSNCFWDTQTSGQSSSAAGTGKTTAEMKTLSTFTSAGWDFEGEIANGTNNYWDLSGSINNGYPYLSWLDGGEVSLPVELTSFTAELRSGGVLLNWSTESEIENLGFIIERKLTVGANQDLPNSWAQIVSYQTDPALEGHGSTTVKHDYQFTDKAVQPGPTYEYRLGDVDYSGKITWHKTVEITVETVSAQVPGEFGLQSAYPNPFNPAVTLSYGLKEAGQTTLQVYNMRGQLVETLVNTDQIAGNYDIRWQPVNLSTGVYIVRLQSGNQTNLQKIVYVK